MKDSTCPEAVSGKIRARSPIINEDYPAFRSAMKAQYPTMSYKVIRDIWNFGNDQWSDGFNYKKEND